MIKDVLNSAGDWKTMNDFPTGQRPVFYELIALENAIEDYISEYKNKCGKGFVDYVREIKPTISNYNIYGRIVNEKVKGCSHFYKLLCTIGAAPCNRTERDLTEFNPSYNFEKETFF